MQALIKRSCLIRAMGLLALLSNSLPAEVRLPGMFGDNMVLQYGQKVSIWGWAAPGEQVTVQFADQSKSAVTDPDGKWMLALDPMQSNSENQTMTVLSDRNNAPLTIHDILVGDVWLCSGQSNMEVGVGSTLNAKEEIKNADYPLIRHLKIEKTFASSPQEDAAGRWRIATPSNVHHFFSAVGYYFAREVFLETNVPIGLINASWGSTRIEPWIGPQRFQPVLDVDEAVSQDQEKPKTSYQARQMPGVLYNAMIHPLLPYAIRGVLWYQGESNVGVHARKGYRQKQAALIQGWRQGWGRAELPFYFVQLASYGKVSDDPAEGDGWSVIREAQRQCFDESRRRQPLQCRRPSSLALCNRMDSEGVMNDE